MKSKHYNLSQPILELFEQLAGDTGLYDEFHSPNILMEALEDVEYLAEIKTDFKPVTELYNMFSESMTWACMIVPVEGGFYAFESEDDFDFWAST